MKTKTKAWLIVAASLMACGIVVFAAAMASLGWEFAKLSTSEYETSTYEITDSFSSISVNTDTADIIFAPSVDGKCKVVCHENVKLKHAVSVKDGVLSVDETNSKEWYDYIGINFESTDITIYLPETELENITLKTSTGRIGIENISANKIDISVSTGKVELSDVNCKELTTTGNTGNLFLESVFAEKMYIKRSTGHVQLDGCDSDQISIETNTGDVKGSLLSGKDFECETSTGDIDVPDTVGGKCRIKTSTGDIKISISE